MANAEHIRPVLEQALAASGLVLDDVAVTTAGHRRVVRILVDRDLGTDPEVVTEATEPLSLDEVADATRLVSDALDASDAMGEQPYTLEVSSPGVGRPLTEPRHYRRNVGRLLELHRADDEVIGRLTAASLSEATIEVPAARKTPARTETVSYADVRKAVVQVEFARHDESKES
ncbi:ribosome maturation factor RimP [Oryzobacter telluris]|jgi:ribosome maturation factor RimP|uniref:ribosome maturation factor RimP n=1 Tax=Oryzobacter telluris TaxID=3149179 RepID=UPI00370CFFC3